MVDTKKEQERDELHRAIWAIADELRGAVDGWDFKNYVLGTMFYRYDTFRAVCRNCILTADQWIFHVSICVGIRSDHGNTQCGACKRFNRIESDCNCGSCILCVYDWGGFDDGVGIYGCDRLEKYLQK